MIDGMSKPKKTDRTQPAEGRGPVYNLRLSHDLSAALTAFVNAQKVPPDKSQVLLKALEKFLEEDGFWPPKPGSVQDATDKKIR